MTCPHCGARNTVDAPWCTQCLHPLGPDPAPPAPSGDEPAAAPMPSPAGRSDAQGPTPAVSARHGAFRSVDGQVQWCCESCETWNGLDRPTCAVCGSRLAASVTGARADDVSGRVGRARRVLWVAAAVGGTIALVGVALLVLALRSGVAG